MNCLPGSEFTDDTVMTLAVKSAILNNEAFVDSYRRFDYYQHHCVGAYDSLFFAYPDGVNKLDVSILVNLHMQPYFWEKNKERREKTSKFESWLKIAV